MTINYQKELIISGKKILHMDAARYLVRRAFPDLVTERVIKSKAKDSSLTVTVDWRPIFNNEVVRVFLSDFLYMPIEGAVTAIDATNGRMSRMFIEDGAGLVLRYPPEVVAIRHLAKVAAAPSLSKEELNFIHRYYS